MGALLLWSETYILMCTCGKYRSIKDCSSVRGWYYCLLSTAFMLWTFPGAVWSYLGVSYLWYGIVPLSMIGTMLTIKGNSTCFTFRFDISQPLLGLFWIDPCYTYTVSTWASNRAIKKGLRQVGILIIPGWVCRFCDIRVVLWYYKKRTRKYRTYDLCFVD